MIKLLGIVAILASVSFAGLITVVPTAKDIGASDPIKTDLSDLDHSYAYLWRINLEDDFSKAGVTLNDVTGVTLKIENIQNWKVNDPGNVLFMNLLNQKECTATDLVIVINDGDNSGNYFAQNSRDMVAGYTDQFGYNLPNGYAGYTSSSTIAQWSDSDGPNSINDLSYNIDLNTFKSYVGADGIVSIGFDSDCHFYNDGVSLEIKTKTTNVPEPTTLSLLGLGILGLSFFRRKK